jgi:hypothetical protein
MKVRDSRAHEALYLTEAQDAAIAHLRKGYCLA